MKLVFHLRAEIGGLLADQFTYESFPCSFQTPRHPQITIRISTNKKQIPSPDAQSGNIKKMLKTAIDNQVNCYIDKRSKIGSKKRHSRSFMDLPYSLIRVGISEGEQFSVSVKNDELC